MNTALRTLYDSKWPDLNRILGEDKSISRPLLLKVPPEYEFAATRLLVIGQQTKGWGDHPEESDVRPVLHLMELYERFAFALNYPASPFWQASHELYRRLNPGAPPRGFLWSNLVKVDQDERRPAGEIEEQVCQLGLVPAEVEIVRPRVVVFFTGRPYDARLSSTFAATRFFPLSNHLARLEHPALPFHTYRSPHPNWLRRSGNWDVLSELAQEVLGRPA